MKWIRVLSFISVTALATSSFAKQVQPVPPDEKPFIKICGSMQKEKTQYDGIQVVFTQLDDKREPVTYYYLRGMTEKTRKEMNDLVLDKKHESCVIGLPSDEPTTDSPPFFLGFELLF